MWCKLGMFRQIINLYRNLAKHWKTSTKPNLILRVILFRNLPSIQDDCHDWDNNIFKWPKFPLWNRVLLKTSLLFHMIMHWLKDIPDFIESFQTFVCYANLVDLVDKCSHFNRAMKKLSKFNNMWCRWSLVCPLQWWPIFIQVKID